MQLPAGRHSVIDRQFLSAFWSLLSVCLSVQKSLFTEEFLAISISITHWISLAMRSDECRSLFKRVYWSPSMTSMKCIEFLGRVSYFSNALSILDQIPYGQLESFQRRFLFNFGSERVFKLKIQALNLQKSFKKFVGIHRKFLLQIVKPLLTQYYWPSSYQKMICFVYDLHRTSEILV